MAGLGLGSHFQENAVPPTCSSPAAVSRAARHAYVHSKAKATVRRAVCGKPLGEGWLYTDVQMWKSSRYSVNFEYKS